jgi:hypothetical protein
MKIKRLLAIIIIAFISVTAFAQNQEAKKLDRIITRDYKIIEATISKITEQTIDYSFPNEQLVNSMEVIHVARIEFANGRVQTFVATEGVSNNNNNPNPVQEAAPAGPVNQDVTMNENLIAVLPVPFVDAGNMASSEEMAKFAQNDIFSKLNDKSSNIAPLNVQDLRVTNSLLRKAGIDYKSIDETPIDELHKILGADHIVAAKVSYTTSVRTTSTGYNTGNEKYKQNKTTNSNFNVSNSNTNLIYRYKVYFEMYKNNTKIYTQSRQPFLNLKDSWIESVSYLLKRSPIYEKK